MPTVLPTDYERARRHLMRRDPILAAVIKQVGPCKLSDIPDWPPFMALAEAIASQQLSVKAADTIFGRLCDLFGPDRQPDPVRLLTMEDAVLRGAGFSRAKVLFLAISRLTWSTSGSIWNRCANTTTRTSWSS